MLPTPRARRAPPGPAPARPRRPPPSIARARPTPRRRALTGLGEHDRRSQRWRLAAGSASSRAAPPGPVPTAARPDPLGSTRRGCKDSAPVPPSPRHSPSAPPGPMAGRGGELTGPGPARAPISGRDVTGSRAEAGVGRGAAGRGDCAGTAPEPRGAALDGGGRAGGCGRSASPRPGARRRGPGGTRPLATAPPGPPPRLREPRQGGGRGPLEGRGGTSSTAAPGLMAPGGRLGDPRHEAGAHGLRVLSPGAAHARTVDSWPRGAVGSAWEPRAPWPSRTWARASDAALAHPAAAASAMQPREERALRRPSRERGSGKAGREGGAQGAATQPKAEEPGRRREQWAGPGPQCEGALGVRQGGAEKVCAVTENSGPRDFGSSQVAVLSALAGVAGPRPLF